MKTMDAVKIGGILFAGVAAYLLVTRVSKAGGDIVKGATEVITKDLNPASTENVVYKTITKTEAGQTITEKLGDFLGFVFDRKGYEDHMGRLKQIDAIVKTPTGTGGASNVSNQTPAEDARLKRYQLNAASAESARNLFNFNYENM